MLLCNARKNSQGFTMIEILIILMIISILSAIAAPSFLAIMNRAKVKYAFTQVQGALKEVQREAIRRSQTCTVALTPGSQSQLSSNCFVSADQRITASQAASQAATTINVNQLPVAIPSGTGLVFQGGAVAIVTTNAPKGSTSLSVSGGTSDVIAQGEIAQLRTLPNQVVTMATDIDNTGIIFSYRGTVTLGTPATGKIVFFPSGGNSLQKCLVISTPLGLVRAGDYSGATASASNITAGTCITSQ